MRAALCVALGSVVLVAPQKVTTIEELASTTKAKDEMKLEYRLTATDGLAVLKPHEEKLKASVDGEDLLTPLVRRAPESIVAAASLSRQGEPPCAH